MKRSMLVDARVTAARRAKTDREFVAAVRLEIAQLRQLGETVAADYLDALISQNDPSTHGEAPT